MSETVIGLFPESEQAQEVVPMLANHGFGRADVDLIGGRGSSLSGSGSDLLDKLSRLGVDDADEQEWFLEGVGRGGMVVAARTPNEHQAEKIIDLMKEHGATHCLHAPDTGWTSAS